MLIELVTLGRDSELRSTASGTPVLNFAAAYDIGFGQNKKTQWIDCVIFGKKGESLVDHLKKGKQIQISAKDVRIESWEKNDGSGQGFKLACTLEDVKFCRDGTGQQSQQAQQGGHGQQKGSYNQASQQTAQQQVQRAPDGQVIYGQQQAQRPAPQQRPQQSNNAPPSTGFDDFEDDGIPFN